MNSMIIKPESTPSPQTAEEQSTRQEQPVRSSNPSYDEIAQRAYDIHEKKGRKPDQCLQDWFQAERELKYEGRLRTTE